MTLASMPALQMTRHLPRAMPWRPEGLPIDDGHEPPVLGAFSAWLVNEAGARQRQQAASPEDAEIGAILTHRLLPPVPRTGREVADEKSRSTTAWPIRACGVAMS